MYFDMRFCDGYHTTFYQITLFMEKSPCSKCHFISKAARVLTDTELETLESKCAQVSYSRGEVIFKQNALSTNIIYLKTGLIKLHMKGNSRDQIIKIVKAPAYTGLPTTFAENINQYSATALLDTVACFIDVNAFKSFINKNGDFAYEIIVNICHDSLDNYKRCVNRNQKKTTGRVADALIFFAERIFERKEYDFPLSRNDLADLICSSRESVSRIINDFHNDGLIDMNGKNIQIKNLELLKKIAQNG